MHVLVVLFGLATAATGFMFMQDAFDRRARARRQPVGPPGVAVDIDYLGDRAVVKVYPEHGAFAAHVYWHDEFVGSAGGFNTVDTAIGWGRSHARSLGADV